MTHSQYFNILGLSFLVGLIGIITFFQIKYNFFNESSILLQYDYIIVGGGTAGCVVAGKLAANSNYSILLIESGDHFNAFAKIPLAAPLFQRSKYDWSFKTTPQLYSSWGFSNQTQLLPRGKGLGGSNQINYLVHSEPKEADYQIWRKYNITSWNYTSLHPYFRKMEDNIDESNHRYMHLDDSYLEDSELYNTFVKAVREVKNVTLEPTFATLHDGKRWTSYDGYLKHFTKRNNIHVLLNTFVKRVIFSGRRAIAVETNSIQIPKIYVRKEIILSAGVIQTPQILLLSGIGPKLQLEEFNISMVANVPKVGENLYDHMSMLTYVSVNRSVSTTVDKVQTISEIWKYLSASKGLLSYMPIMGIGSSGSDITMVVFGMGSTDESAFKDMSNFKTETFRSLFPLYHNSSQEGFVFLSSCVYPNSRGYVRLASSNPNDVPIVNPNYLSDESDLTCMIKGLRVIREVVNTKAFQKMNATIYWPNFEECRKWYSQPDSDAYLGCIIRVSATTGYHPAGTCRMGNSDESVVNEQLRVRGVRGLRIVDSSILPSYLTHFPNSLTVAMADRAASLILHKREIN